MRLLLTGAAGFAGAHLLPALRRRFPGAHLAAAGREAVPAADRSLPFDLAAPGDAAALVRAVRPDAVLHLAAQSDVAASFRDPRGSWAANLDGTLALAEAVRAEAPGALFLFAGSSEAYGLSFQRPAPLDEEAPFRPANPYAASKAAADLALGEMALRGLRAVRLRLFSHTGPGQTPRFVVPAFARQVARIEAGLEPPVMRTGALDRWRDFSDVADVCEAYAAAVERRDALEPGVAINICAGAPRRVGDILDALTAMAGIRPAVEPAADLLRPTDVVRVGGDRSRAQALLGWAPRIPWEETLRRVLEDWRARVRAGE